MARGRRRPPAERARARSAGGRSPPARAVFDAARDGRRARRRWPRSARSGCCARTAAGPTASPRGRPQIEGWLAADVAGFSADERWYAGRPLLVTAERLRAAALQRRHRRGRRRRGRARRRGLRAPRRGHAREPEPARGGRDHVRDDVHKAQGSQFGTAAVLLPDPASRMLTRELLYTAITRARDGADPRGHRGGGPRRGRAAGRPRVRPPRAPLGGT